VADLVIDYTLLNDAAGQLDALNDDIGTINNADTFDGYIPTGGGNSVNSEDLGPGNLGDSLANFYGNWAGPLSNAGQQVQNLAATFRGVAQTFFDADASQAAAVNAGLALSDARNYPSEQKAYQNSLAQWNAMKDPNGNPSPGVAYYYNGQGQLVSETVAKPTPPFDPNGSYSGTSGVTTTYTTSGTDASTGDPLISSETTSVSDDGLSFSETTTYGSNLGDMGGAPTQDTVQTIHHADGSTDVITTDYNLDGSGTSTDVNTPTGGGSPTTTTTDLTFDTESGEWQAQSNGGG
jgi:hypothetical protein